MGGPKLSTSLGIIGLNMVGFSWTIYVGGDAADAEEAEYKKRVFFPLGLR